MTLPNPVTRRARLCRLTLIGCALLLPRLAWGAGTVDHAVSGLARLTTDYIQRGYSKTEDGPSVQLHGSAAAGRRWTGLHAGAWLNRVQLGGARWEAVPYVGWRRALGRDWQVDGTLAGYLYDEPFEAAATREAHYGDAHAALHFRDWLSVRAGVAIAPYGFGGSAPELDLSLRHPLSDILQVSASLGHAWLDDFAGYAVTHYAVGLGCLLGTYLQADLRWHGAVTSADRPSAPAHTFFERLLIDDRIVGSISISF